MTEKLWHVDFGEKLYKVLIKISEMLGGHRSPGVVPPPIYTKQPRFCSLPTLYRTPIECNIRYAFSLLITVHSNIEMKEQSSISSQLGYSWHDFLYACLSDLSVGLSMLSASHHSFRLQRGASAGSRRRWSRCRRRRRCRYRRHRGRRLNDVSWVMVSVPCFFLASEEGNKKTAAVIYFCLDLQTQLWAFIFLEGIMKNDTKTRTWCTYFFFKEIHENHNHNNNNNNNNNNNLHFPFRRQFLEGQKCLDSPTPYATFSGDNYPPKNPSEVTWPPWPDLHFPGETPQKCQRDRKSGKQKITKMCSETLW